MRGSGKYFNGGRGSFRGNSTAYRSPRSFGNRMDNGRRGGQRFNMNSYGSSYMKYDRRGNVSPVRDYSTSRAHGKSMQMRDQSPLSRRNYRGNDRDRNFEHKQMRNNDHRRLNSTRRGNRTPPPPPPPPISGSSTYRGSIGIGGGLGGGRGGSVDKSPDTYTKASRHGSQNNRANNGDNSRFSSNSAARANYAGSGRNQRPRYSMNAHELRTIRKKVVYAQQRDRVRALRMARLTSHIRRRRMNRSKSSEDDSSQAKEDEASVRSEKGGHKSRRQHVNEDDGDENDSNKDEKESKKKRKSTTSPVNRAAKVHKPRSQSTKQQLKESDTESEHNPIQKIKIKREPDEVLVKEEGNQGEDVDKNDAKKKKTDVENNLKKESVSADELNVEKVKKNKASSSKSNESSTAKENANENKAEEENNDDNKKKSFKNAKEKILFKLTCVHCHMKSFSFKQYSEHLYTFKHKMALQQVNRRQRAYLVRLRARQRATQREIEENVKEDFEPQFCNLCRLHYRIQKAKHQLSEHHCAMKKFLLPYCSVCRLSFKSPMSYEVHRCSIDHLRLKAHRGDSQSESEDDKNTREIDLNNFLTVDSVGETDGDSKAEETGDNSQRIENPLNDLDDKDSNDTEFDEKRFIKRVDAFYCALCDTYAASKGDIDVYVSKHCDQRLHKKNVKHFKIQEQKKKALKEDPKIKIDKPEVEIKKDPDVKIENDKEKPDEAQHEGIEKPDVDEDEYESEDKLWADVDKDIGDILAVVEEDESVLNIDIESDIFTNQEKKSKETSSNKKDHIVEEVANGKPAADAKKN